MFPLSDTFMPTEPKKRIAVRVYRSQFEKLDKLARKLAREGEKPNLSLAVRKKLTEAGV